MTNENKKYIKLKDMAAEEILSQVKLIFESYDDTNPHSFAAKMAFFVSTV